jgi:hypothetical protein
VRPDDLKPLHMHLILQLGRVHGLRSDDDHSPLGNKSARGARPGHAKSALVPGYDLDKIIGSHKHTFPNVPKPSIH